MELKATVDIQGQEHPALIFSIFKSYGFFIENHEDVDKKYSNLRDTILYKLGEELDESFKQAKENYDRNTQQSNIPPAKE